MQVRERRVTSPKVVEHDRDAEIAVQDTALLMPLNGIVLERRWRQVGVEVETPLVE